MPQVQRSSDLVEMHSEKAISFGLGGIVCLVISGLLFAYRGSTELFVPLSIVLAIIAASTICYAIYCLAQVRKVTSVAVTCPYCKATNKLLETPSGDFTCIDCHRLIPVIDGQTLPVNQVRCGFCNELNYYSEKTDVLLCEYCNHEIPIAHEDGFISRKKIASGFSIQDDDRMYELVLLAHGHKTEELVDCLQHMLALNRNQVKQMLGELPVTLLTGIPKRKAEMLKAQLVTHEAAADYRPLAS